MKVIRRRVPAKTVVSYQCEVCGTKYSNRSQAEKCERRTLEDRLVRFKKGNRIEVKVIHSCNHVGTGPQKLFSPVGIVIKVIGPVLSDLEYEVKWLGGKPDRVNGHVFQYLVRFQCVCGKTREGLFYLPELVFAR